MTVESQLEEEVLVPVRWKFLNTLLKVAGQQIDPETTEVDWTYIQIIDPYGVLPQDFVEQHFCIGRGYFARAPGSDLWIEFGDLPDATHKALRQRYASKLAFPAGLTPPF
jgi:hypothetical protein